MWLTKLILIIGITMEVLTEALQSTRETQETNREDDDVAPVPTTEQIFDPNIKLRNSADFDEAKEEDEEGESVDSSWDKNLAIRDVAYFLRGHKFHDYDRRYYTDINDVPRRLYEEFPKPRLKALHWEVHKECEAGFMLCLKYLQRITKLTALRREDDTVTVMRENNWNLSNNTHQINVTQKDCEMRQKRDDLMFVPFQGPIERFQWRTSASYYMCWFTMLDTPELTHFGEPCDNHADCLGNYGTHNKDPRADDKKPFACALYSFCPDPCCPKKHILFWKDCFQSKENPCYEGNPPANRKCTLNREENQDFDSLMKNEINTTCECRESGFEWSARFGLCVDVNECHTERHNCSLNLGQTCFNLPGHFDCICRFGYMYNPQKKGCVPNPTIQNLLQRSIPKKQNETKPKSIFALVAKTFNKSSSSICVASPLWLLLLLFPSNFQ